MYFFAADGAVGDIRLFQPEGENLNDSFESWAWTVEGEELPALMEDSEFDAKDSQVDDRVVTDEDRLIATGLLMYLKMIKDKVEQDAINNGEDL